MADPASWLSVEKGWKVLSADGDEFGSVAEVLGDASHDIFDGLAVSTGFLSKPVYVASEHVGEIVVGTVRLELSAESASRLRPYDPPRT